MSAWSPYVSTAATPWNLQRVMHLHRRAAFGATWTEAQRDAADDPQSAVSRVLQGSSRQEGLPADFEQVSESIRQAALQSEDASRLKAWWVFRCLFSPDPLSERLTLMWHNHFATSLLKVTRLEWMDRQQQTIRRQGRQDFSTLLHQMLKDPALLSWLDASKNDKSHPNENLARELLELFALGIGNYTEIDIRETARALTGLKIQDGDVVFEAAAHDAGTKRILGQTAAFNPDTLPQLLLSQPACSQRIAWRFCREFFGENVVRPDDLQELAEGLRAHHFSLDWIVETILRSELFFSQANLGSRVADPASFLLCPLRALECWHEPPSTLIVADSLRRMGLDLLAPPNVGGWPGGRAWLSTLTVIAHTNAVVDLVQCQMRLPALPLDLGGLLKRHGIPDRPKVVLRFFGELLLGSIRDEQLLQCDPSMPDTSPQSLRQAVIAILTSPAAHCH